MILSDQAEINYYTRDFDLDRFRRMGARADAWALQSESTIAREIYARIITQGKSGFQSLLTKVSHQDFEELDILWLARLSRVLILNPENETLLRFSRAALDYSVPRLPVTDATLHLRKLHAEVLFSEGEVSRARQTVESHPDLREHYHGYLLADLCNPFVLGTRKDFSDWLELFNTPFRFHNLRPLSVDPSAETPFNSLRAEMHDETDADPLVSVILTTFNPDREEIQTSAGSILKQSWRNLELLIVDDGSDGGDLQILEDIQDWDPRVRLIRLPANGGTYRSRNVGLREARGYYVTGQDTDDWSHPERLAHQVQVMRNQPGLSGVMTSANRMDDQLVRTSRGYNPHRRCEVSLMVRRDSALAVGGYLPVRKGADSEFRERIETWSGMPTYTMPHPLYLIRMSAGSLSRSDFRPGWSHHARRSFWSAYKYWHRTAPSADHLVINEDPADLDALPFTPPPRISGRQPARSHTQLCFACDWREDSLVQRAALDEIAVALDAGISVSVLHLESPYAQFLSTRALIPSVQELINDERIEQLSTDDDACIDLLIIRDPAVVDYAKKSRASVSPRKALLVGDDSMITAPTELWGYHPTHAQEMVEALFGVTPTWALINARNSTPFSEMFRVSSADVAYPLIIPPRSITQRRRPLAIDKPIIGRSAVNVEADWPKDVDIRTLYPIDGTADVRVLGDARGGVRVMGNELLPASWIDFRNGEIEARIFWRSVEFAVHYDRRGETQSFSRDVLEAMAAGCVVISTPQAASTYADAVVGAVPSEAVDIIKGLSSNEDEYDYVVSRAQAFLRERCSPAQYLQFLLKMGVEITKGALAS